MDALIGFLDAISSRVFWFAAVAFVVMNGAAIAVLFLTRSRKLVNNWTGPLVAANALLLGAGLGVPLLTALTRIGVKAVASMLGSPSTPTP